MEHYFKSYARPNLFDDESDDDDACVETPLITPIHSAATIPIGRKQSGGSDSVVIGSYEVSYEEWDVPHHPTLSIMTNKVTDLNDKVTTFDAVFVKAKAIGNELKGYQIATAEATCIAFDLNQIQSEGMDMSYLLDGYDVLRQWSFKSSKSWIRHIGMDMSYLLDGYGVLRQWSFKSSKS
nr:hypothetical protein [Tanacetum cinerariifolium]